MIQRAVLACLLVNSGLFATTLTWQGTTNSMNTGANWSPSGPPVAGDILIFPGGVAQLAVLNNVGALTIGGLTISDTYTFTGSAFTISPTQSLTYGASGSNINLGGVTLGAGATWNISSAGAPGNTITSNITGTGNLDLTGGVLVLKGTNTYSGTTTLGTGATLQAGSTTAFSQNSSVTLGSGSFLSLINDSSSFSNTIGLLSGSSSSGSTIALGTATLTITNTGTPTFSGSITGTNAGIALGVGSTGTLTLSGNNTYSTQANPGTTTVTAGILKAGSATAFGTYSNASIASGATLNLNDYNNIFGTLNGAGTLQLGTGNATITQGGTFSGIIGTGSGALIVDGGTLILSGVSNSYTGTTTIQGGSTLQASSLGSTSGIIFVSGGGTLQANASLASSIPFTLTANGAINTNGNSFTLSGLFSGPGSLTKQGTGTLTLSNAGNNYTGATTVSGGTLTAGSTSAFGSNSAVTVAAGATLNLAGFNNTIASLAGNNNTTSSVTLGSASLTINNGTTQPFYGIISGTGNLILTGGTLSLMGTNTYGGTTTIQGGSTLNTISFGSTSSLIFSSGGGKIELGSAATTTATLNISAPATIGTNTFNVAISGNISGGSPLNKIGLGVLTLTGTNTSAAQITIEGGTLNLTSASLGSTTALVFDTFGGTLQAGGALTITQPVTLTTQGTIDTNGSNVTISNTITGPGDLGKSGTGTLTISSAGNNYTGLTFIENGTLNALSTSLPMTATSQLVFSGTGGTPIFQAGGAFPAFTNSVVLMNNGTIDTNGSAVTISGIVAGLSSYSLTKIGAGTLTFSGLNIYTGATNVNVGTLQAGVATTASGGAFGIGSAVTVASGATLAVNSFNNTIGSLSGVAGSFVTLGSGILTISNGNSQTFSGVVSGTGGLTLTTGTQTLSGLNTYTGATTINGGTLQAGASSGVTSGAFGNNSAVTIASGATLAVNSFNNRIGSLTGAAGSFVTLGNGVLTINNGNNQTFAGIISGSGTGGLTLTTGTQTLSGLNTYTGSTTVNGGTLQAGVATTGSNGAFGNNTAVTIANTATLDVNSFNNTIRSLTGVAGSFVTLGSGILTLSNGDGATFAGVMSGTGGLTLTTGTQTLSGLNTYTGATTINGGTLQAGATNTFSSNSDITVNSGGTLSVQAFANSVGDLINSGSVTGSNTITASSFTQNSGASLTLNVNNAGGTQLGNISTTGAISLNGTLTVTNTGGFSPTAGDELILLQSSGTGKQLSGSFSSTTQPFSGLSLHYDYSDNQVILGASTCSGDWIQPASGNWGNTTNWQGGCAPGVNGLVADADVAHFGTVDTPPTVVVTLANSAGNLAQPVTLHYIEFVSSVTSYHIEPFSSGGSPITLNTLSLVSKPKIIVTAGSHTINAPIILGSTARFSLSNGTLTLRDNATVTSTGLTQLIISEGIATGTLVNYGSVTPASLLIEGTTIQNYATMSPTGVLTIGGILGIASPASMTNHATMSSGGAFTIGGDGATIVTNPGTMNSASTFTINGAGSINVTNSGTMNATTTFTINSGTVSNSSGGQMYAGSGSTFSITGGTVVNDASSTLGSANADLTFSGGQITTSGAVVASDYTQSSPAILNINVSSISSFGSITTGGTAILGGTLNVTALPNFSMTNGQTINLITAVNQITTQFGSYTLNFPSSVIPSLLYLPNAVQLDIRETVHTHSKGSVHTLFASLSQHNIRIERKCLQLRDRFRKTSSQTKNKDTQSTILPEDSLYTANNTCINAQSPLLTQNFTQTTQEKQQQLTEKLSDKSRITEKPWSVYVGPTGSFGNVKTKGNQTGFGYNTVGALFGFDYAFADPEEIHPFNLGLGTVIDYSRVNGNGKNNWGSFTIDKIHGSIYGTLIPKSIPEFAIDAIAGYGHDWDSIYRHVGVNEQQTTKGKPAGNEFDLLFAIEYMFSRPSFASMPKDLCIIPLANIQYIYRHENSYKETNAGIYNLQVANQTEQSLRSFLGTRINQLFFWPHYLLRAELDFGWQREYLNHSQIVDFTAFNITNQSTTGQTFGAGRNTWLLGIDLLSTIYDSVQIECSADAQWNSLYFDASFYLGIGGEF